MGTRPRICASVTGNDPAAIAGVESAVDLLEVRIDLIGIGWKELAGRITIPWIACNRRLEEGGRWEGTEAERLDTLIGALELGADIIDIELGAPEAGMIIDRAKGRAECLVSYHDLLETPSPEKMRKIIGSQLALGADICKLVTTACSFEDNLSVLRLITEFPGKRIVSFAMGEQGYLSRVLSPVAGADFTYASIDKGKESAPGQITAGALREIYGILRYGELSHNR